MRSLLAILAACFGLLSVLVAATASADEATDKAPPPRFGSDPEDPSTLLNEIRRRRVQRESLLPVSPLKWLHDATGRADAVIYRKTCIALGLTLNHLFQWASDALPGKDDWGTTTDLDFVASWELANRGQPTQGELYVHVEGRWDYGTTGPQTLGFESLGTAGGTANAFSEYVPTFLVRNLYWEQGSQEAGWAVRIGKITPDSILATSAHVSPVTTFLPHVGTGFFSSGYPDSGLGVAGIWFPNNRLRIMGLVSDANANRFDFGDIGAGDFYKAAELGVKLAAKAKRAGFSKFTVWHTDATKNGSNAALGPEGWGLTAKVEHELTCDGRAIGILRWGKSWNDSSLFEEQAGAHFLYYDPPGPAGLKNDVVGVAVNWVKSVAAGARDEYNVEVFYRFALFPGVDTRLSYQSVINPALTRDLDHVSLFSLGLRSVF